jgi:hypothetical protein
MEFHATFMQRQALPLSIYNHTQVCMCTMYQDVYVLQYVYSLIYIDRSFRSLEAYITSITLCTRTRDSIDRVLR